MRNLEIFSKVNGLRKSLKLLKAMPFTNTKMSFLAQQAPQALEKS